MKKILKIVGIILLVFVVILGIAFAVGGNYVKSKLEKMNIEEIDKNAIGITQEAEKQLLGYRNIAIFGVDSRADDYGKGNINYSDSVHITAIGHQKLSQYISQF
mgnify:CR=1 FL=1